MFVISSAGILVIYLQPGLIKDGEESYQSKEVAYLSIELDSLRNKISDMNDYAMGISEDQRSQILSNLKTQFLEDTSSLILSEIEKKITDSDEKRSCDNEMETRFQELRSRLAREIKELGKRGGLALALGIVITALGLIVLALFVVPQSYEKITETLQFTAHFVPRLTLVIFIETFAYFFLSLYKSSLSEIKYFQNELTNIEAQWIALRTAVILNDGNTTQEIVKKIGSTERNFVISKRQTTVDIEKARIEKEGIAQITKYLPTLLHKKYES